MPDYARLAVTARRLIQKNGRTVTLILPDTVPATPAQPWRGPDDDSPTDELVVKAIVFPGAQSDADTLGMRVEGDGFALLETPATGEDLNLYHTMNDRGVLRAMSEMTVIDPGGNGPVMYAAVLGGGA